MSFRPGFQGINECRETTAKLFVAFLEALTVWGLDKFEPATQVAKVTGLGRRTEGNVEKMQILTVGPTCRSFNNVGSGRDRGLSELVLQPVAFGRWKVRRRTVNLNNESIREVKNAQFSMIATHGQRQPIIKNAATRVWAP
jgi:hypothetical protein